MSKNEIAPKTNAQAVRAVRPEISKSDVRIKSRRFRPGGKPKPRVLNPLVAIMEDVSRVVDLGKLEAGFVIRESRTSKRVISVEPRRRHASPINSEQAIAEVGADRPRTALTLAHELLADPEGWLQTPNDGLGNRPPMDLIGTDEEQKVYNMLNAADLGLF